MTPKDLGIIREGAHLQSVLPYIQATIAKLEAMLDTRMYALLVANQLTPEVALQAWMQKHAYHQILRRFEQAVNIGVSVGERNVQELSGDPPLPI